MFPSKFKLDENLVLLQCHSGHHIATDFANNNRIWVVMTIFYEVVPWLILVYCRCLLLLQHGGHNAFNISVLDCHQYQSSRYQYDSRPEMVAIGKLLLVCNVFSFELVWFDPRARPYAVNRNKNARVFLLLSKWFHLYWYSHVIVPY